MTRAWLALALALAPAAARAQGPGSAPDPSDMCARPGACGTISGPVKARGDRTPVAGVAVIAVAASSRVLRGVADPASAFPMAWPPASRSSCRSRG